MWSFLWPGRHAVLRVILDSPIDIFGTWHAIASFAQTSKDQNAPNVAWLGADEPNVYENCSDLTKE